MKEQNNSKVPQIRFKGFEDGWLEDRLEERVEFFSGLTYSPRNVQKGVGTLVLRSSNVKNGEIVNADNVYVDPKIVNSKNVEVGDIAVVVRNGSRSLIGKHAQIKNRMDNTVIGAFMTGIHSKNPAFTNALLDTPQFDKEIEKNLGATINQITTGAFRQMMFRFPRRTEQTQIGGYFREVDRLIGLHQRKHDKLVTLKKAMLQKMFPQPGTTTPEIRFKGFSVGWKKEAVSSLLTERNIQFPKSAEYPLMAFIAGQGVAPKGKRYNREFLVSDEVNKKYKRTELGDFIYSSNNLETGSIGTNKYGSASISPVYSIFSPTVDTDSSFIGQLLCQKKFINEMVKWRQGVVYGQWRIHESDFLQIEVTFPTLEEQQKIGSYFRTLDELISKHAIQLQKLTQIKSACLKKMFV